MCVHACVSVALTYWMVVVVVVVMGLQVRLQEPLNFHRERTACVLPIKSLCHFLHFTYMCMNVCVSANVHTYMHMYMHTYVKEMYCLLILSNVTHST